MREEADAALPSLPLQICRMKLRSFFGSSVMASSSRDVCDDEKEEDEHEEEEEEEFCLKSFSLLY